MAVISATEYKNLSDYLAQCKATLLLAKDSVYSAVYEIALFDEIQPSIDLLSPFFSSYEAVTANTQTTTTLNSAVAALNNHVLRRTNASLDSFLQAGGTQVDPVFAQMSANLGFTISSGNIEP